MALGARFFIKKPYDPEELLDAIKRALEEEPESTLNLEDIDE
jgi:FixJ family two-component response regulator